MPFCPTCGTSNIAPGTCISCAGIVPDVGTIPVRSQVVAKNNSGRTVGIVVALIIAGLYGANQVGRYGSSQLGSPSATPNYLRPALGDYNSSMRQAMSGGTSCSTSDFTIKGLSGSDEYGYANILGTIVNHCSEAAGVQLKVTLYNASGNVVNTEDPWPASVSNIPPGTPYPFKLILSSQGGWTKYGVRPIDVKKW